MPHDKKLHTAAGFVIALAGSFFYAPAFGLCCAVIAGLLVVLFDITRYDDIDLNLFLLTSASGLLGAILTEALK